MPGTMPVQGGQIVDSSNLKVVLLENEMPVVSKKCALTIGTCQCSTLQWSDSLI